VRVGGPTVHCLLQTFIRIAKGICPLETIYNKIIQILAILVAISQYFYTGSAGTNKGEIVHVTAE